MEEEEEWESKLTQNIFKLLKNSGADATAIIVDGTSVRKQKGLVMISGNFNMFAGSTSTEIYDYRNDTIKKGPDMKIARCHYTSATLQTGDIALFGGFNSKSYSHCLSACEVFNVESNLFSEIGDMFERRDKLAAVLLRNGLVLIIGGSDFCTCLKSCEFYNPVDKAFSRSKAKLMVGRSRHSACLLPDGRVLVCGGYDESKYLRTTEIYDPSTDSFSDGPEMAMKRADHTATALFDGKIIICGGEVGQQYDSTEFYDPSTNSFSAGPHMIHCRNEHFASILPDGRVLIGGGDSDESKQTTEIYDPKTNSFTIGCNLLEERYDSSASPF